MVSTVYHTGTRLPQGNDIKYNFELVSPLELIQPWIHIDINRIDNVFCVDRY